MALEETDAQVIVAPFEGGGVRCYGSRCAEVDNRDLLLFQEDNP